MIPSGRGKVMYCGCFYGDDIGQLAEILNRLNSARYIQQDNLNVTDLVQFNHFLQQDNALIHKVKVVMTWFKQQGYTVMP